MSITIINIAKELDKNPPGSYFYCGRGSPVGNPFVLGQDGNRDKVCDDYQEYFDDLIRSGDYPKFLSFLNNIVEAAKNRDIRLGCFCVPRRCHCETVKRYVEKQLC